MLRRVLNLIYGLSAILGAGCLALVGLIILVQMVGRMLGMQLRGADDLTAWAVAAGAMFSLAYSFRHGAHIRVGLLLENLGGRSRRFLEIACLVVGAAMAVALAASAVGLAFDSFRYHDIAPGLLKVPMWIPQSTMGLGALFFAVALLDDLFVVIAGGEASYAAEAQASALERAGQEI